MGRYDHQVPMPINTRVRYIDHCIGDIVASLNASNIKTKASCQHKVSSSIILNNNNRE